MWQQSYPRKLGRAGMIPMPLVDHPFQRIAMEIIGPLPLTKRGNRFILTICDYTTRYPEAIALSSIEATRIATELISVFSRMGVPDEILTDQGPNFMSTQLEQVYQMLQVRRIRITSYHPQTDGLAERFNRTLKSMLRKFVNHKGTTGTNTCRTCYLPTGRFHRSLQGSQPLSSRLDAE